MQRPPHHNSRTPSRASLVVLATCVAFGVVIALVVLPGVSSGGGDAVRIAMVEGSGVLHAPKKTTLTTIASADKGGKGGVVEEGGGDHTAPHDDKENTDGGDQTVRSTLQLEPWGYNRKRNVPRWVAIRDALSADITVRSGTAFTVVDYGADQGYFSISIAKTFPKAQVFAVEMGGVGGEIWKKADSMDVLKIQEAKFAEHDVSNVRICQTKVSPDHFFALKKAALVSDFQLVLSVFHWFNLPTRAAFDEALSTLLLNARTTFIELPVIGDNGKDIRKQVGWANFVKWYDGRTDMTQIISEAAKAHSITVKVARVAQVSWLRWSRETYRVEVVGLPDGSAPKVNFGCQERRTQIYKCANRERFSTCEE